MTCDYGDKMALMWIWIGVILLVLIVLFKFKEVRHKLGLVIVAVFIIFLLISVTQVYTSNEVDLTTFDGVVYAAKVYFNWLGGVFHNVIKVSNYAIHQDWDYNSSNYTGK